MLKHVTTFFSAFLLCGFSLLAQNAFTIRGTIQDAETKRPLEGAYLTLDGTDRQGISDSQGNFVIFNVPSGNYIMSVGLTNYVPVSLNVKVQNANLDLGIIQLLSQPDQTAIIKEDFIPTISLSD